MGHKPSAPTYNKSAALAEQKRLNQAAGLQTYANLNSPLGGYSVYVDPETGKMTVNKTLSDNSILAQQAQANALTRFVANPQEATQAYYDAQMAYVQPQFDAQIAAAQADLANRGIAEGSPTWNKAMAGVMESQDRAKTAMINDALFNGQEYQTNLLNQAGAAGNMVIDPTLIDAARGAGLADTYDKKWQNEQDIYKTKMGRYNANLKAIVNPLGNVSGAMLGGLLGSGNGTNNAANVTDVNGNVIGKVGGYGTYQPQYFNGTN